MTILIPLLMGGLVFGAALANGRSGCNLHIAVVTQDPHFGADLKSELESTKHADRDSTKQGATKVDVISPPAPDTRALLANQLRTRNLAASISATPSTTPPPPPPFPYTPN